MGRVRYSEQFKRDAVRLVTEEGYSKKRAAESVGVCVTTLRAWLQRYEDEAPPRTVFASQADEIEQLRAENRRLRMERDIFKKSRGVLREGGQLVKRYQFIREHRRLYPLDLLLKIMGGVAERVLRLDRPAAFGAATTTRAARSQDQRGP